MFSRRLEVDDADAQTLISAVCPLWPAGRWSVRRIGPVPGARSWLVIPSLAAPVLLVPPRCPSAALSLRPQGTGNGEVKIQLLGRLQRMGLLRLLPLPRLVLEDPGASAPAVAVLERMLGPVGDVVVRLGRRRYNRALVLLPIGPRGEPLAFVKVARGTTARRVLQREHESLAFLSAQSIEGLRVPTPIAHVEDGGLGYLMMTTLISDTYSRPRPVPVAQMRALSRVGRHPRPGSPLRETRVVARLRRLVGELNDPGQRRWTGAALDALLAQLGDVVVPEGTWHGDWVPWNMSRKDGEVFLWDWEHFDVDGLASWDHAHFLAQDLRVRSGTDAAAEDAWLEEARAALHAEWGLDEPQRSAVLRAYLLEVNLRYLHDRQEDPRGTPEREGWARELIDRLDPGPGSGTAGGAGPDVRAAS